MIKAIDYDNLNVKLLDMEFPIQDQDAVLDLIDDCTVNVDPIEHGGWIERIVRDTSTLVCSICGTDTGVNYDFPYCPTCGAMMDLKEGDNNETN